jgi:transposase
MGAERLPMRQIREILRLKHDQGLRHRAIARACGVGVGTVSEYLGRVERAGLGWPLPPELDDTALEARLFPAPNPGRERVAPDCGLIHQELKRPGVTLHLLWEEYRQVHEQGYGYSQFCELYRRWAVKLRPSMRQVHRAGEKTFIDFSGKRPHLIDGKTGEEIPVQLFVGVLGASCYTYAEATPTQKLHDWISAHTRMLEYFSGSTEIWSPTSSGVASLSPAATSRESTAVIRSWPGTTGRWWCRRVRGRPRTRPRWRRWCWWRSAGSWPGYATAASSSSPS